MFFLENVLLDFSYVCSPDNKQNFRLHNYFLSIKPGSINYVIKRNEFPIKENDH